MTRVGMDDIAMMRLALAEALRALDHDDVPVGAIVVDNGAVVASRHNEREVTGSPFAHAELLALGDAHRAIGTARLASCELVVTLEPCVMCAGGIRLFGVGRVVFGADEPRSGACGSRYNVLGDVRLPRRPPLHTGVDAEVDAWGPDRLPNVTRGVLGADSARLLGEFFARRRAETTASNVSAHLH
jgi:tRNA(adenine34) deaminase